MTLFRVCVAAALTLALAAPGRAENASPLSAKVAELEAAKHGSTQTLTFRKPGFEPVIRRITVDRAETTVTVDLPAKSVAVLALE